MDTPAPSKERESNGFKIQRSNLRKIAELKQQLKALEENASTTTKSTTNKERESTSTTKNKNNVSPPNERESTTTKSTMHSTHSSCYATVTLRIVSHYFGDLWS